MKYWKFISLETGAFMKEDKPFTFSNSGIHFKGKNYSIIKTEIDDNDSIFYFTECIRCTTSKRIKRETLFGVHSESWGYSEKLYIETER